MTPQMTALLDAFQRAGDPQPADLLSAIKDLPAPPTLPSPWETWTLIGLFRHRNRQRWVADIIRERLRGSGADLAAMGAMGHPEEIPPSGTVPGMPEWEYHFHGRGCCVTHKVSGDSIDVDFWDDSSDYFDTYFYTKYLDSLRQPGPSELRLRELHRSTSTVRIAVEALIASGALTPLPGRDLHPYRVSDAVLDHADAIETFCDAWGTPSNRLWLSALCGDWLAAHEAADGRPDFTSIIGPRAELCRGVRRRWLQIDPNEPFKAADKLHALADMGAADLDQCLIDALQGPPSAAISAALDIIEKQDDPRWGGPLYSLFRRTDPSQPIPCPHIWMTSLRLLLRLGHRVKEVIASLPQASGTVMGEAVILALELAPEMALPLIRKALLADIPINRIEVAAILAIINTPWSRRELLDALAASDDQEKTADVRAALLETGDQAAEEAVLAWEKRNPHEAEAGHYLEMNGRRRGPFFSFAELSLQNRTSRIRYEMESLHDRVTKLRHTIPPEPPRSRPWWQFWRT